MYTEMKQIKNNRDDISQARVQIWGKNEGIA